MQGKKRIVLALSAITAIVGFSSAFATCTSVTDGWYLEANAGSTNVSSKNYPSGVSASSSGIGGNVNIGYKFMPYFATEMGYTRYTNTGLSANDVSVASDTLYSYDIAFRGILPVANSGFELFAKVGGGRIKSDINVTGSRAVAAAAAGVSNQSHSHTGLYFGGGGQYYFMPEAAFVIQWQRIDGNSSTGTADLFTGGFSFIFD